MKLEKFKFQKTIKKSDIKKFSNLSKDLHLLHSDETFAKKRGFKDIVAHGLLLSSICSSIIIKIFGNKHILISQSFKYIRPVYAEEKLTVFFSYNKTSKTKIVKELYVIVKCKNEVKSKGSFMLKKF